MPSSPSKKAFNDPNGPPRNPWATNLIVSGNTVYVSGAAGKDETGKFVEGDVGVHTTRALKTISDRLALVGLDLTDVTSALVHLTHYSQDFKAMNAAYIEAFTNDKDIPFPTRTCVGVAELAAGASVEITVTAGLGVTSKL